MGNKYWRGYKFKIYPTESQKQRINQLIDLTRYVYNWGIEQQENQYQLYLVDMSDYKYLTYFNLLKKYAEFYKDKEWLKDLPYNIAAVTLKSVVDNYIKYYNKLSNKPRFKSKKKSKKSFGGRNNRFYISDDKVRFPGFDRHEMIDLNFISGFDKNTKYYKPRIAIDNLDNYYVSFVVQEECISLKQEKSEVIGIDLGVRKTFTLSTGEVFNQPNELINKHIKRLKRINKHVTRDNQRKLKECRRTRTKYDDIPSSKRSLKRLKKLNKEYTKISNIYKTYYHTTIKQIVLRNPEAIVMEDFKTSDIIRSKKYMSKQLKTTLFGEILQIAKNKCEKYNIRFIQADKQFPSTQMCSNCGSIKKMYNYHTYICPVCGMHMDRDLNAAINLKNLAFNNQ